MIQILLTDLGASPLTVEVKTMGQMQEYLRRYDTFYTRAHISFKGKNLEAWRFVGSRIWYSTALELDLVQPDPCHTLREWYRYERSLAS